MQCSVNQVVAAKAEKPAPSARNKSEAASAQLNGKRAFKHQLMKARSHSDKPRHKAAEPRASEPQTASSPAEAMAAPLPDGESLCADALTVPDSAPETINPDAGGEVQQPAEALPVLPAETPGKIQGRDAQQSGAAGASGAATASSGPVQTAAPLEGEEFLNNSGGAEAESHKNSAAGHDGRERFKMMLLSHKNQVLLKLKVHQDVAAPQETAESNPGQARKLLDFESRRLNAAQLPEGITTSAGHAAVSTEADADPSLLVNTRETPGATRVIIGAPDNSGKALHNPAQTQELFDQIVERAKLMVKLSSSEMNIDLKPDSLGKLSIKVLVEDGLVTARFITDNHQVKQMLESNLTHLRQNLENQGLKVDRTEVEVQVGNQQDFSGMSDWNRDNWGNQRNLGHRSNLDGEEALPLEMETAGIAGPEIEALYGYSADGEMNILV